MQPLEMRNWRRVGLGGVFIAVMACFGPGAMAQQTHRLAATLALDASPLGAVASPDNTRLAISTSKDELVFYSLSQMKVVGKKRVQGSPLYLHRLPQSRMALLGQWDGGRVAVVDLSGGRVLRTIGVGEGPTFFAQDLQAILLSLTRGQKLAFLHPYSFKPFHEIPFDEAVAGIAVAPRSRKAYVAVGMRRIAVVDLKTRSLSHFFEAALAAASPLQIDPEEKWLFALGIRGNVLRISLEQEKESKRLVAGGSPTGLSLSPDGKYLYVSNGMEGTVAVLDAATLTDLEQIPVGARPSWIAVSADSRFVFVCNRGSNSISVLERLETIAAEPGTSATGPAM